MCQRHSRKGAVTRRKRCLMHPKSTWAKIHRSTSRTNYFSILPQLKASCCIKRAKEARKTLLTESGYSTHTLNVLPRFGTRILVWTSVDRNTQRSERARLLKWRIDQDCIIAARELQQLDIERLSCRDLSGLILLRGTADNLQAGADSVPRMTSSVCRHAL